MLVVVLLAGLTPAAFADPPDPTWVGGYWDDDDLDAVVAFIAGSCAILGPVAGDNGPMRVPVAPVEPTKPPARPVTHRPRAPSRAPPLIPPSCC